MLESQQFKIFENKLTEMHAENVIFAEKLRSAEEESSFDRAVSVSLYDSGHF